MSTELNKKLLDAIESDECWEMHPYTTADFIPDKAATACEKIALQAQIDLLNRIMNPNEETVYDMYKQLQEQLNQLK